MSVDPDRLKYVLSHLPGGVCVVTAADAEGQPSGLTAISVCSVSLDPPIVLACIEQSTNTHAAIASSGAYALNFLADGHRELAERFSGDGRKFEGVEHTTGQTGAPVLAEAVASCHCRVTEALPAGDHTVFIARVEAVDIGDDPPPRPLVRYRGRYTTLDEDGSGS